MPQTPWFTRLGPLGSILGALLTGLGLFLPLILTAPPPNTRYSDPYPPTLDGRWLLGSLFTPQSQPSSVVTWSFVLLVALAAITLGTGVAAWFLQASLPGVVSWIRAIAAVGGLMVLLCFLEFVTLLNFHGVFGTGFTVFPRFSMGFGIVFLVLGSALSAVALGAVGIGALVGAGIGYLLFLTPLYFLALPIGLVTCLLGALAGWLIERAVYRRAPVASS